MQQPLTKSKTIYPAECSFSLHCMFVSHVVIGLLVDSSLLWTQSPLPINHFSLVCLFTVVVCLQSVFSCTQCLSAIDIIMCFVFYVEAAAAGDCVMSATMFNAMHGWSTGTWKLSKISLKSVNIQKRNLIGTFKLKMELKHQIIVHIYYIKFIITFVCIFF